MTSTPVVRSSAALGYIRTGPIDAREGTTTAEHLRRFLSVIDGACFYDRAASCHGSLSFWRDCKSRRMWVGDRVFFTVQVIRGVGPELLPDQVDGFIEAIPGGCPQRCLI